MPGVKPVFSTNPTLLVLPAYVISSQGVLGCACVRVCVSGLSVGKGERYDGGCGGEGADIPPPPSVLLGSSRDHCDSDG